MHVYHFISFEFECLLAFQSVKLGSKEAQKRKVKLLFCLNHALSRNKTWLKSLIARLTYIEIIISLSQNFTENKRGGSENIN